MKLTCDTCGRVGNEDDGIEPGGPCQEPCDGIVRLVEPIPPVNETQALMFIRAAQAGEVDEVDLLCLIDNPVAWMLESSTHVAREMLYALED